MKLQQFWKKFFYKLVFMAAALSLAACSGREEKIDSSGSGQKEAAYQAAGKEVDLGGVKKEHIGSGLIEKIVFLNGRLYAASYNQIYVFDEKGREERVYRCPGYLYEFCRTSDGKLYVYRNDDEAGKDQNGFCEFDPKTGKCGKFFALEEYSLQNDSIVHGKGSGIYLNDDKNIYAYDCSTGKMKEELNWFNCGRDGDSICCCFLLEQGKYNRHLLLVFINNISFVAI